MIERTTISTLSPTKTSLSLLSILLVLLLSPQSTLAYSSPSSHSPYSPSNLYNYLLRIRANPEIPNSNNELPIKLPSTSLNVGLGNGLIQAGEYTCRPMGSCEPCPLDSLSHPSCVPFSNRRPLACTPPLSHSTLEIIQPLIPGSLPPPRHPGIPSNFGNGNNPPSNSNGNAGNGGNGVGAGSNGGAVGAGAGIGGNGNGVVGAGVIGNGVGGGAGGSNNNNNNNNEEVNPNLNGNKIGNNIPVTPPSNSKDTLKIINDLLPLGNAGSGVGGAAGLGEVKPGPNEVAFKESLRLAKLKAEEEDVELNKPLTAPSVANTNNAAPIGAGAGEIESNSNEGEEEDKFAGWADKYKRAENLPGSGSSNGNSPSSNNNPTSGNGNTGEIYTWEACPKVVSREKKDFREFVLSNTLFLVFALTLLTIRHRELANRQYLKLAGRIGGNGNGAGQ